MREFESHPRLSFFGGIAQLVEHRTVNPIVTGSIPVATVRVIIFGE